MICRKLVTRTLFLGPVLAAMLGAGVLVGCAGDAGSGEGRDSGGAGARQEVSEQGGGESGGEHAGGVEGAEGSGGEVSGGERRRIGWRRG